MEGDALAYGVGHDSIVVRSEISSSFFTLAYGPRAKPVGSVPSAQRAGREGAASFLALVHRFSCRSRFNAASRVNVISANTMRISIAPSRMFACG